MGSNLYFHLISASNYIKYLRPSLIRHYGAVRAERVKAGEKSRLQLANIMKKFDNRSRIHIMSYNDQTKGPFQQYFKNGGQRSLQSYNEKNQCFKKYATPIFSPRNHFLRWDDQLQQTDSFSADQGYCMKVANILQVENYCSYIEQVKILLQQHQECPFQSQDLGVTKGFELFKDCYQKMKNGKEETYLIYEVGV